MVLSNGIFSSFLEADEASSVEVMQHSPHLDVSDFTSSLFRCSPGQMFGPTSSHPHLLLSSDWVAAEEARLFRTFPGSVAADLHVQLQDATNTVGRVLWSAFYPLKSHLLREDGALSKVGKPEFESFCTQNREGEANGNFAYTGSAEMKAPRWYKLTLHTRPRFENDPPNAQSYLGPQPAGEAVFRLRTDLDLEHRRKPAKDEEVEEAVAAITVQEETFESSKKDAIELAGGKEAWDQLPEDMKEEAMANVVTEAGLPFLSAAALSIYCVEEKLTLNSSRDKKSRREEGHGFL